MAGVFVLVMGAGLSVAGAQTDEATRLSRMERDIETLSRTVYKGEQPPAGTIIGSGAGPLAAQTEDRLSRIEQDLRDVTGRAEEQGNALNQIKMQLDRVLADLQLRVTALEQKVGIAASVATSAPSQDGPSPATSGSNASASADSSIEQTRDLAIDTPAVAAAVAIPSDPTQAYENAMALLKQRDYPVAEKSLADFIKTYPDHDLTQNAKYWLGETYFAQNKYDFAVRLFAEGYQQYPKGPKAPDNLLKMGLSLAALGDKAGACVALQQIGKDYAVGANAVNTRAKTEIKRLKCP